MVGFLGVGAVIWEGSRQMEKMRGEMATREAVVHGELTKREVEWEKREV